MSAPALLFPGQGSQRVGMGGTCVASSPSRATTFAEADEALGEPLSSLCFERAGRRLTLTENAQPASARHLGRDRARARGPRAASAPAVAAGHSLGE